MKRLTRIQIISTCFTWLFGPTFAVAMQFIATDYPMSSSVATIINSLIPPFLAILLLLIILRLDKFIQEIPPKIRLSSLAILCIVFAVIITICSLIYTVGLMHLAITNLSAHSFFTFVYQSVNSFIGSLVLLNLYLLVLRIICQLDLIFAINQNPSL